LTLVAQIESLERIKLAFSNELGFAVTGTYGYRGASQSITISTTGTYDLTAYGAAGGDGAHTSPGDGAEVSADFVLQAGTVLELIVGGVGGQNPGGGGGGGGGSFIIETFNGTSKVDTPLLVAGGGGGGSFEGGSGYAGGSTKTSGGGGGGRGGGPGMGGGGGGTYGGGGGGFSGGAGTSYVGTSGGGTGTGYAGGGGQFSHNGGGFGGGGGGGAYGGGGGGGYGGGGGGGEGGGGGFGTYGGGGGGGSDFVASGASNYVSVAGENAGAGSIVIDELCYLRGTRILTPTGEAFIEDLAIGDLVVTRFSGLQPIKWIGRQSYDARFIRRDRERLPICIRAGALGQKLPARDLYVSPGHSILIDNTLILARNLVNGLTITQDYAPAIIDYFQIELAAHDCVVAEGSFAETFADGPGLRAIFHNAADYAKRYPDEVPPDAVRLCAERPERGPALESILRPITARAAAYVQAGPLQGYVDRVGVDRQITGWAQDISHPELPVMLEIVVQGQVIGTILACDYRADLKQVGIGQGFAAFSFTAPSGLPLCALATISVRRMGDGSELMVTGDCKTQIEEAAVGLPTELSMAA
jgi:hypothetical protein